MRFIITAISILCMVVCMFAQTPIILENEELWLHNENVLVFEDLNCEKSRKDIFQLPHSNYTDFTNENIRSCYWLYFELIEGMRFQHQSKRIEMFDFNIDEISFFILNEDSIWSSSAGFQQRFSDRQVKHKNVSFLLPSLEVGDTLRCLMRFRANRKIQFKPVVRTYDRMFEYAVSEYLFFGVYYGLMILVVFYNLLYFLHLRKAFYIYYICFAFAALIYLMALNGTGFQFLWPSFPAFNAFIDQLALGLAGVMLLMFTHTFLGFKNCDLEFKLLITAVILRVFWLLLQLFFTELRDESADIIVVQLALVIGFRAFQKGFKSAKWFVVALCVLDASFIITFLEHNQILPSNLFTVYVLYLGTIIQFVYLSLSIAESHKDALRDRNEIQEKLIDELRINEELKQKVNEELEDKVKLRTQELTVQKELVEEKNRNILDSVKYAENIQKASLPTAEQMREIIGENHFVVYQPRDIVSGDFYWVRELNEYEYLIAAVDCTGHGVPGAFMSMIGINLLHRVVSEGVNEPALILKELNQKLQVVLNQEAVNNHDGMDMSICKINKKSKVLTFAGAHTPIIYSQNGETQRLKGSRYTIGGDQGNDVIFDQHTLNFSENPLKVYLYSDGIIDQFGGKRGKKFMTSNFIKFLDKLSEKPSFEQGILLENHIKDWIGDKYFQLDDIMVIGLSLN